MTYCIESKEAQGKSNLEKTYKCFRLPDSVRAKQKVQKSKEQNRQVNLCYVKEVEKEKDVFCSSESI